MGSERVRMLNGLRPSLEQKSRRRVSVSLTDSDAPGRGNNSVAIVSCRPKGGRQNLDAKIDRRTLRPKQA